MIDALTQRQRDVVELVAEGRDNQQIADEMQISILTVKKHLQTVFRTLNASHRTQLAATWHRAHSVKLY
jgi:DNA-binding NarL/FixJ family response regulator